jgi:hypothetical protein
MNILFFGFKRDEAVGAWRSLQNEEVTHKYD